MATSKIGSTLNLVLFANQAHLAFAATTVASVCRRTRRQVHARVYVRDGDLPEAFHADNLTVEFARPRAPLDELLPSGVNSCADDRIEIVEGATDWDRCRVLDTAQLALGDLEELDSVHGKAGVPGDLEWGRGAAPFVHWAGAAKPWSDPSVPGAQLWLRELTDWDELKHELAFRERDRDKIPAFLIHLARLGVRQAELPDALEDAGFGLELLRGCDPQFPVAFRGSVGLLLEWFGWRATRANMARALSHRWAWEAFLQQSDARYAVVCEDGIGWQGTETEMRERCERLGDGPWLVDLAGTATGAGGMMGVSEACQCGKETTGWKPVFPDRPEAYPPTDGRAYCLSREAARLLLERDYCNARASVNPHDPISPLSVRSADREWASGSSVLAIGTPPATGKILVGICSCRKYGDKRQAVRETWFPRGVSGVEAVFFVGDGDLEIREPDTVCVPAPDSYHDLPAKVLAFFRHALEHCEFDWLFKCDDDTYLAADRLHGLLDHGVEHVGNHFVLTRGAPDGGAGYLLSRRLVELLATDPALSLTGPEDIIIGEATIASGATHAGDGRLIRTPHPMPRWDNQLITCHQLSPHDLHTVHALIEPPHNLIVVRDARGSEDHILLHRHHRYSRKVAREAGTYEWREGSRQLILHRPHLPPVTLDVAAGNLAAAPAAARSGPATTKGDTRRPSPACDASTSSPGEATALHPELAPARINVSHASWCDGVELGVDGRFSRISADDGGTYDRLPDSLVLQWDRWEPESFVRMPDAEGGMEHYCLDRVAKAFPISSAEDEAGGDRRFHAVSDGWIGPVTLLKKGSFTEGRGLAGNWANNEDGDVTLVRQGRPANKLRSIGGGYQGERCRLFPCSTSFFGMWRDFDPRLAIYRKLAGLGLNVASPWGDCPIPCGCRWDVLLSGENIDVRPGPDGFEWNAWGRTGAARWFVGTSKIADESAFHLPHFYDYWCRYGTTKPPPRRPRPGISFVASNAGPRRRIEIARQLARWFPVAVSSGMRRHFADLPGVTVADVPAMLTGKLDFIANFTFNLCFENGIADGYLTEKPFQALWAGTVPVYEGDPGVAGWIEPSALVDCSGLDATEIADRIREAERAGVPEWVWTEREKLVKVGLEEMIGRFEDFLDGVREGGSIRNR